MLTSHCGIETTVPKTQNPTLPEAELSMKPKEPHRRSHAGLSCEVLWIRMEF